MISPNQCNHKDIIPQLLVDYNAFLAHGNLIFSSFDYQFHDATVHFRVDCWSQVRLAEDK